VQGGGKVWNLGRGISSNPGKGPGHTRQNSQTFAGGAWGKDPLKKTDLDVQYRAKPRRKCKKLEDPRSGRSNNAPWGAVTWRRKVTKTLGVRGQVPGGEMDISLRVRALRLVEGGVLGGPSWTTADWLPMRGKYRTVRRRVSIILKLFFKRTEKKKKSDH